MNNRGFMSSKAKRFGLVVVLALVVLVAGNHGIGLAQEGNTLTVCASGCDFATIQAAVNAATAGDTIQVQRGTYKENLTIAKPITLQGADRDTTMLSADLQNPAIIITGAQDVTIADLKVTNGSGGAGEEGRGGGLHIEKSTVILRNVIVHDNVRHGLLANQSTITVQGSQIINNRAISDGTLGRGIALREQSIATIENTTISDNDEYGLSVGNSVEAVIQGSTIKNNGGVGVFLIEDAKATIQNTTISDNGLDGLVSVDSAEAVIQGTTIKDNRSSGVSLYDGAKVTINNSSITGTK